ALLTLILLVASASGLAFTLSQQGALSKPPVGGHAGGGQGLAPEATVRRQAVTWILHQVSRAATVACDSQVCADLPSKGFPSADLLQVGPQSTDPLPSDLVVATADIRAQFGARLTLVYAPAVIASFGSGNTRIDIRLVYPGGAKGYHAIQHAAL